FALHLKDDPSLRALYLDAEHEDGYHRDQNVFAPGVTIEDDMAVLVRYSTGATMTYHLTAYSPWEGYRGMFNASAGRLELEVNETDHVKTLPIRPFWKPAYQIDISACPREGHGGADVKLAAALFAPDPPPDPLRRSASERDGALALLTGLAANASI